MEILPPENRNKTKPHPLRDQAKLLFFAKPEGSIEDIANLLGINKWRVYKWAQRDNWEAQRLESEQRALQKKALPQESTPPSKEIQQGSEIVQRPKFDNDRTALSPEKMAEIMATRSINVRERFSKGILKASEHIAETMDEDELVRNADKINNLVKAASTVHGWDGVGQSGAGGININILTDEVKIVQLSPPVS
jgi:hypothetical protein